MLYVKIERDGQTCVQWMLMKWHNAEKRTPALQTENSFCICERYFRQQGDITRQRHFCDVRSFLLAQDFP